MPVQISARLHDFSNPIGFLSDCHDRIGMFLAALESVAAVLDCPLTDRARGALETSLRYFRESAPKHNADEEESLFPRMRGIHDPEIQSALAKLGTLEEEHRWAAALHEEVDRLGRKSLAGTRLSPTELTNFRKAVAELAAMYRQHIRVEEDLVFPAAARWLPGAAQAAVGQEMAARRKLPAGQP